MSAASLDRRKAKLKTTLDGKIPRCWYRKRRTGGNRVGKRWRDSNVPLVAVKYMHSLGNEESAIARGPVLSSEKCKSTQLLATLQATIPESLQTIAEAQVKVEGSTTLKNAMIVAANLYTDQLELAGAQLGRTLCNL
jgi:hypothetical protein